MNEIKDGKLYGVTGTSEFWHFVKIIDQNHLWRYFAVCNSGTLHIYIKICGLPVCDKTLADLGLDAGKYVSVRDLLRILKQFK